ncbi:unnamed protein product [Mytilus coruscus]|uniref:Uncharacterized protein n=1 Tax=Mytilus coruscus TaxID=42192 RepID=A0A6J8E053_MYTCO|nr:unnamed protein product [Mytilus coruscus]
MAESHTRNASIALYHNLCQNIVGTEEHVKAIRMINAVRDNLQSDKYSTIITSGSFGDGLDMQGSDIDVMLVMNYTEVCEGKQVCFDADKIYVTMETDDTHPGFTKLRVVLVHSNDQIFFKDCDKIGSDYYFLNSSFKQLYSDKLLSTVHGPCVSDKDGIFDFAYCLHSKLWNKMKGQAQEILFKNLNILKSNGWQCILLSKQISNIHALAHIIRKKPSCLQVYSVKQLLSPVMDAADSLLSKHKLRMEFEKVIHWVLSTKSSKIKYLYTHFMSKYCQRSHKLLPFDDKYSTRNKSTYKQRNTYICTLLLNTCYDAVSGWLLLASLFYRTQQHNIALFILGYSLSKCTKEKIYRDINLSHVNYESFDFNIFRKMTIVQMEKLLLLHRVEFVVHSRLIPDELQIEVDTLDFSIPPEVYAHFLSFLCHYHLNNTRHCRDSLQDLQLIVKKEYSMANDFLTIFSESLFN